MVIVRSEGPNSKWIRVDTRLTNQLTEQNNKFGTTPFFCAVFCCRARKPTRTVSQHTCRTLHLAFQNLPYDEVYNILAGMVLKAIHWVRSGVLGQDSPVSHGHPE